MFSRASGGAVGYAGANPPYIVLAPACGVGCPVLCLAFGGAVDCRRESTLHCYCFDFELSSDFVELFKVSEFVGLYTCPRLIGFGLGGCLACRL